MEETKNILLIGAGGHCISVLDSLVESGEYNEIGIIDREQSEGNHDNSSNRLLGVNIVGSDKDLNKLYLCGYKYAFVTIGSIGDITKRKAVYEHLKKIGFIIPNIIDKTSILSRYIELGEGIFIGKNTVINARVNIGTMSIINTAAVIEHGSGVGDYVHISPGCIINGDVMIDYGSHIGAGSIVKQGIRIGSNAMIGMGSVVIRDIGNDVVAYGNPCKEVRYE